MATNVIQLSHSQGLPFSVLLLWLWLWLLLLQLPFVYFRRLSETRVITPDKRTSLLRQSTPQNHPYKSVKPRIFQTSHRTTRLIHHICLPFLPSPHSPQLHQHAPRLSSQPDTKMNNDQMEKLPARLDALFLGGRKRSPSSSSAQSAAPVEKKTKLKVKRKEKLPATLESSARDARVLEQVHIIYISLLSPSVFRTLLIPTSAAPSSPRAHRSVRRRWPAAPS